MQKNFQYDILINEKGSLIFCLPSNVKEIDKNFDNTQY